MQSFKKIISTLLIMVSMCMFCSCGSDNKTSKKTISAVTFNDVTEAKDYSSMASPSDRDPVAEDDEGIVISEDFALSAEGVTIPVYASPVKFGGPHSYAYITCNENDFPFTVKVSVLSRKSFGYADVIPEKLGVKTDIAENEISFNVTGYEKYSLIIDKNYVKPLTVVVRKPEQVEIPANANVIEYKAGVHDVNEIVVTKDDTWIYIHEGAIVRAAQPKSNPVVSKDGLGFARWNSFIRATGVKNLHIVGTGIIDFSHITCHARRGIEINGSENVGIEGVTIINAAEWTVVTNQCKDVVIDDLVLIGHRLNSDGVAIVDTQNAVVTNCFARTGDDHFEVKSITKSSATGGNNIVFRNCKAWPDSCRGFGVISETVNDISDVTFEDCAVLYRITDWWLDSGASEWYMGSLVICLSDSGRVSNITFRNIEIYSETSSVSSDKRPLEEAYFINIAVGHNVWSLENGKGEVGTLDGVVFENISCRKARRIQIKGGCSVTSTICDGRCKIDPEQVTGLVFRNVTVKGKKITSADDSVFDKKGTFGKITVE